MAEYEYEYYLGSEIWPNTNTLGSATHHKTCFDTYTFPGDKSSLLQSVRTISRYLLDLYASRNAVYFCLHKFLYEVTHEWTERFPRTSHLDVLIYAVLSQNFFCRDLQTFRAEKNAAKILVHGEKKSDKYRA